MTWGALYMRSRVPTPPIPLATNQSHAAFRRVSLLVRVALLTNLDRSAMKRGELFLQPVKLLVG